MIDRTFVQSKEAKEMAATAERWALRERLLLAERGSVTPSKWTLVTPGVWRREFGPLEMSVCRSADGRFRWSIDVFSCETFGTCNSLVAAKAGATRAARGKVRCMAADLGLVVL